MLAGAGFVLAITYCSAGGAAAAEVRPATRTVTGEQYSTANLVNTAAALFFLCGRCRGNLVNTAAALFFLCGRCPGSALLATRAVHLVNSAVH